MNGRNLICWGVVLAMYVLMVIWGNSQPVETRAGTRSAWSRLWRAAESTPVLGPPKPEHKPRTLAPPPPAKSRKEAEKVISDSALRTSFERLAPALQPSIRVAPLALGDAAELPKGASRAAAPPDVPAGFTWPQAQGRPLTHLAQIRLEDVAAFDAEGLLPKSGWLCFFFDTTARPPVTGRKPADRESWRVMYFGGDAAMLQRAKPPQGPKPAKSPAKTGSNAAAAGKTDTRPPAREPYPCSLRFWQEWTLPQEPNALRDVEIPSLGYYAQVCAILAGNPTESGWHHLFGHAQSSMDALPPLCQLASNGVAADKADPNDEQVAGLLERASDWLLLLEIEPAAFPGPRLAATEDEDWESREGTLYFFICRDDLKARKFERVWALQEGVYPASEDEAGD